MNLLRVITFILFSFTLLSLSFGFYIILTLYTLNSGYLYSSFIYYIIIYVINTVILMVKMSSLKNQNCYIIMVSLVYDFLHLFI